MLPAFHRRHIFRIEYGFCRVLTDLVERVNQRSDIRIFLFALRTWTESHTALFDRTEHVDKWLTD
ncbi:hypothetical protein D3C71_2178330 [compost metagenome]